MAPINMINPTIRYPYFIPPFFSSWVNLSWILVFFGMTISMSSGFSTLTSFYFLSTFLSVIISSSLHLVDIGPKSILNNKIKNFTLQHIYLQLFFYILLISYMFLSNGFSFIPSLLHIYFQYFYNILHHIPNLPQCMDKFLFIRINIFMHYSKQNFFFFLFTLVSSHKYIYPLHNLSDSNTRNQNHHHLVHHNLCIP